MNHNSKPRILMFAPLCYPPAGSEAIVTSKLVLAMIDAGWQIDVITQADFGHYYPSNNEKLWEPILSVLHSIEGIRKGGFVDTISKSSPISFIKTLRPFFWAVKAAIKGWGLMRKKQYDCIISRAAPQYGHLPALMLSFLFDIPWIANWSDPMPPQKAPPPYGEGKAAKLPVHIQSYYKAVAARASQHIFPCERLRKYCSEYISGIGSKSSVIPHIALSKLSVPASETREFTLCHAGSLTNRDTRVFLEGVKQFIQQNPIAVGIIIKFIGPNSDNLVSHVNEYGLEKNVKIYDVMTYMETQTELSKAAVLVIIEAQCDEGIFFPSKFTDYVQAGRPILALSPMNGTLHDIFAVNEGGIAIDNRSVEAVANAVSTLYSDWTAGILDKKFDVLDVIGNYDEQHILQCYLNEFKRLSANKKHDN